MTGNDDGRSNAIDSAVLKISIHILIIMFICIWYFLVYLYTKPSTFNCWCRPKKSLSDGELTACNGRCMVIHASRKHGARTRLKGLNRHPQCHPPVGARNVGNEFPRADEHGRVAGRNEVAVSVVKCTG